MNWLTLLSTFPWLSTIIWGHFAAAALILLFFDDKYAHISRAIALLSSIILMGISVYLWIHFDRSSSSMQFIETHQWLPMMHIDYTLGVDGFSLPLVALTTFTNLIVMLSSWRLVSHKVSQYLAAFMVMQGMVVGLFCSLDAFLFYVFWEGTLIPMYLCIGVWGSENRSYAADKFFVYTFFGSALMLLALIYLGLQAGTFYIPAFFELPLNRLEQDIIFFAFLLSFAIKMPMWPFHTWLPDAHTEAPAGGSVILAALMLKIGGYGFIRFSLPIVPDASSDYAPLIIMLSLIAIVVISLVAFAQKDMKRLIAYSSVAHMGFVSLGCFILHPIFNLTGTKIHAMLPLEGAMVQMIAHAFGSGAMFLAFGMIYERMHTRNMTDFGGIAQSMPIMTAFFVLFCLANIGVPGTSGFVGEMMIVLGTFRASFILSLLAGMSLVVAPIYTLWMVRSVFYGIPHHDQVQQLQDIDWLEALPLSLLAMAIFILGVYPDVLINVMHPSINHLLDLCYRTKLG